MVDIGEAATLEVGLVPRQRKCLALERTMVPFPGLRQELLTVINGNPRYVFWNGTSLPESATGLWQEDLRVLMKAANLWIKGNLSHRFRDTAVDFWLSQGVSLTDVAELLGDTVAIVERHYKDLDSKRQEERLAKLPVRSWTAGAQ